MKEGLAKPKFKEKVAGYVNNRNNREGGGLEFLGLFLWVLGVKECLEEGRDKKGWWGLWTTKRKVRRIVKVFRFFDGFVWVKEKRKGFEGGKSGPGGTQK